MEFVKLFGLFHNREAQERAAIISSPRSCFASASKLTMEGQICP